MVSHDLWTLHEDLKTRLRAGPLSDREIELSLGRIAACARDAAQIEGMPVPAGWRDPAAMGPNVVVLPAARATHGAN